MLGNWIRMTTTTTGTGDLTLSSVSGYPTFNDQFSTTSYFMYTILNDSDGTPIESGIGHLSASTTMVRDRILATYSSGTYDDSNPSAISLASGTKRVICSLEQGACTATPISVNSSATARAIWPQNIVIPHTGTSAAVTANRCYYFPIVINTPCEISTIKFRMSSGASGAGRVGLYSATVNGKPGSLLYESASIDTSVTGVISSSITRHRPKPGLMFIAFASNSACTPNATNVSNNMQSPFLGTDSTFVQASVIALYETLAGGWSNLPSTANSTLTEISTGTALPILCLGVV